MEKLLTQRCSRNLFRACMVESVSGTRIYYIYIYIERERDCLVRRSTSLRMALSTGDFDFRVRRVRNVESN